MNCMSGCCIFVLECCLVCLILIFFEEITMNKNKNIALLAPYGSMKFAPLAVKVGKVPPPLVAPANKIPGKIPG